MFVLIRTLKSLINELQLKIIDLMVMMVIVLSQPVVIVSHAGETLTAVLEITGQISPCGGHEDSESPFGTEQQR